MEREDPGKDGVRPDATMKRMFEEPFRPGRRFVAIFISPSIAYRNGTGFNLRNLPFWEDQAESA